MKRTLNITNGSSAIEVMKKAGISGYFLSWDDVLHVGPVPSGLSFANLSEIRAEYIIDQGWASADVLDRSFRERSILMSNIEKYEKVILWFEYDLYDQLQLLEILNYLSEVSFDLSKLSMICTENYLGRLDALEMSALKQYDEPVSVAQVDLAVHAWKAFRSNTPLIWCGLLNEDTTALPFLEAAVLRMLEEYPSKRNGLSRIQNDILDIVSKGEQLPKKIFVSQQNKEERVFLGDTVFIDIMNEMLNTDAALLSLDNGNEKVTITKLGLQVLDTKRHWLEDHSVDKWIGGVHLGADTIWLWNSEIQKIERV